MMGAGKSSVARALAEASDAVLIDLDRRIELLSGRTIPSVFQEAGEVGFRTLERRALTSLLAEPGFARRSAVVATGGGVVVDPRNVADMRASGVTIFLDPPVALLAERLSSAAQRGARPLLDDTTGPELEARLQRLLSDRRPEYEKAHLIDRGDGAPSVVAERLLREISAHHAHL